jgi:tetratricopeptide (TPR) repeat protein
MPPRAGTPPSPGLLLPLGTVALIAGSLAMGWWLGQRSAPAAAERSRAALERQSEQLRSRISAGSASEADRQRLLELLLALGQQRQATTLLEQMADQQPERWQLRLLLAELRRNGNDRSGAERELRQLLNLSPDRIEALQLMTLLQLETGRGAQAQSSLKALLEKASKPSPQPRAIGIGLLLGDLLQRQGQRSEAAALYQRLATDFNRDPRPLLALALLRQEQGDGKGAQEALAQARSRQPEQSGLRLDQVASTWGVRNLRGTSAAVPTAPRLPEPETPPSP